MDGTTLGIAGTRPTITVTSDGTAGAWDGAGATPTIVDGITVGIIPTITEATMEADITGTTHAVKVLPVIISGHALLPIAVVMEETADCQIGETAPRVAHIPPLHATGTGAKALAASIKRHRVAPKTLKLHVAPETARQLLMEA